MSDPTKTDGSGSEGFWQLILHGGACDTGTAGRAEERAAICSDIAEAVALDLKRGAHALDVCEKAVNMLEDDPHFNAGLGSYLQADGRIRMDASIMTSELELGCVLQISGIRNPISVARKLLENPMHCTLAGDGADEFAAEQGFATEDLRTPKRIATYEDIEVALSGDTSYTRVAELYAERSVGSLGTVGCVVRDCRGKIVAGTSTGGRSVSYPGRVGDSGEPGSGTYADRYAGISCTGLGEATMRIGVARIIALYVESGDDLQTACRRALQKLEGIGGRGGVIGISHTGEIAHACNTRDMDFAVLEGRC